MEFYRHKRQAFYASTGLFLLGWMAEALEVYVILYYLGGPAMALSAISIGALSVFIKGGTFFIPGGLGTQDGGNFPLPLLEAFGYSGITGITFALLRRFRELVWIGVGLLCLAMQGRRVVPAENLVQESGDVPDPFLLPRVAPAVPGAGLDRNGIALLVMAGKSGIEQGSRVRRCTFLLNRVEALDHPIPYKTVQPEIRGTFYFDKFNPSQITMHPPHVSIIDRQ